jgi:hypothetical protein
MIDIREKNVFQISGWIVLAVGVVLVIFAATYFIKLGGDPAMAPASYVRIAALILAGLSIGGFFIIHPNEAIVFTFVGRYVGSAHQPDSSGTNPFCAKHRVTLRVSNLVSEKIKVNDACGNPIEIAAVVVWHVIDTAKAKFNVDNYKNFVAIQSETAVRQLASHYPYDSHEADQESLRTNPDQIAAKLRDQGQDRPRSLRRPRGRGPADAPGLCSRDRPGHASPTAGRGGDRRPLKRSSTEPWAWSKWLFVNLDKSGMVELDNDKKAAMVNNLLVALVSENEATPVIIPGLCTRNRRCPRKRNSCCGSTPSSTTPWRNGRRMICAASTPRWNFF